MSSQQDRSRRCARCAQIKQACDGLSPCTRCSRLSVLCVPNRTGANTQDGLLGQHVTKARIRRAHSGCDTCKKRRKKCDEVKPKCGDCRRLCLPCDWTAGFKRLRTSSPDSPSLLVLGESAERAGETEQGIAAAFSPNVPLHQEVVGWQSQVDLDLDFDKLFSEVPFDDWPTCADLSPILLPSEPDTSSPSTTPQTCLLLTSPSILPSLTSDEDRALWNHYLIVVGRTLSRHREHHANPYITYLVPMAHDNDIVLSSLLSLSAKHWRKTQLKLSARGAVHQSKATQRLADLLSQVDNTSADLALASSLILCMTELFDGKSTSWKIHLIGAKRLLDALQAQKRARGTKAHHRFLARLYRFLDSAATTSTCRPPLIEGLQESNSSLVSEQQLALEEQLAVTINEHEEDSAVYGIPKHLFHLVDRVNTLAYRRKFRVDEISEAHFREEAKKVKHLVDSWSFEYGGLCQAVSQLSSGEPDAQDAVKAFEWALRLRLHQIVEGYSLADPLISDGLNAILDVVQKIRYGSPLESCLLFPLVIAGSVCSTLEHRLIVQDRLMVMERTCGFGYVYNAHELLNRVWTCRNNAPAGTIINWARIRFEKMDGLVVF